MLVESESRETDPVLSPDGSFLAYSSDESGELQIYLRPFPEGDGRFQLTFDGGTSPLWSSDGRLLFYRSGSALMVIEIETTPQLLYGPPRKLFDGSDQGVELVRGFDLHPDGNRILAVREISPGGSEIVIVQNWLGEFE